jgi:hypothetical protein
VGGATDWPSWEIALAKYKKQSLLKVTAIANPLHTGGKGIITLSSWLNSDPYGNPSSRPFGGNSRRGRYNHIDTSRGGRSASGGERNSGVHKHAYNGMNEDAICSECDTPGDSVDCPCQDVPEILDEHHEIMSDDNSGPEGYNMMMMAFEMAVDELYTISGTPNPRTRFQDIPTSICCVCSQAGHYARDCRRNGGSGTSIAGARYGTAKGFKLGDNANDRDPKWREWRARAQREYAAKRDMPQRGQAGFNPRSAGARQNSGKFGTHAKRLRTGHADTPILNRYQMLRQCNVRLAGIAEELELLHKTDEAKDDESTDFSQFMTD